MKTCSTCHVEKPESDYAKRSGKSGAVRASCKACQKLAKQTPEGRARMLRHNRTPGARYSELKASAVWRKLSISITREEHASLVDDVCRYCDGTLPEAGHGLDRIDSRIGYELRNVVPCCTICNRAKSNVFSFEEFLKIGAVIKEIKRRRVA